MGIKGLLPLLREAINHSSHIREFSGQRVAVDGYAWLHKAVYSCAMELAKGQPTDKWMYNILSMLAVLLDHEISVTLVFDGADLPAKQGTEDSRALKRQAALSRAQMLENEGKRDVAYTYYSQAVDVNPTMAAQLIRLLRAKHPQVQIVVAPFEADAQLAYLSRNGHVDAIVSEDSDCIPYGCESIIFKLSRDGSCASLRLSDIRSMNIKGFDLRKFDKDMLQILCVAAGCDYLNSVKNFAIKKAHGMVSRHKTATRLLRAMRISGALPLKLANLPAPVPTTEGNHSQLPSDGNGGANAGAAYGDKLSSSLLMGKVTAQVDRSSLSNPSRSINTNAVDCGPPVGPGLLQYEFDFFRALCTFKYQVVFDPVSRSAVHLEPLHFSNLPLCLQHLVHPSEREDPDAVAARFKHFGTIPDPAVAAGIADGLLDPVTREKFHFPRTGDGSYSSFSVSVTNVGARGQRQRGAKQSSSSRLPPQRVTMDTFLTSKTLSSSSSFSVSSPKAPGSQTESTPKSIANYFTRGGGGGDGGGGGAMGVRALAALGPPQKDNGASRLSRKTSAEVRKPSSPAITSLLSPSKKRRKTETISDSAVYLVASRKTNGAAGAANGSNKVPKASSSRFFASSSIAETDKSMMEDCAATCGDSGIASSLQGMRSRREMEAMERLEEGRASPDFNLDRFRNPDAPQVAPIKAIHPSLPARMASENTASTPSSLFNYSEGVSPQQLSPHDAGEQRSLRSSFFDDFAFRADT